MKTTKSWNVLVTLMIVCSVSIITITSGENPDSTNISQPIAGCSSEYLLKNTFLIGRIHNLSADGDYSTVESVNLRIVFLQPIQFFHFQTGEPITFSNQHQGIILANQFLMGRFNVVLPINANPLAVMNTTMGTIILELYADKMPNTTANFIRLSNDGFYNGLVFHRVIDDFVIQGGGYYPNGTERISPYGPIDLEINPAVPHRDGTIGMARTSDPDSATIFYR